MMTELQLLSAILKNEEDEYNCNKFKIFLALMALINIVVFIMITLWTVKFIKVFRLKKKLQIIFFVLVCLSSLSRVIFFIAQLILRFDNCK